MVESAKEESLSSLTSAATHWENAQNHLKHALQKTWYEYHLENCIGNSASLRRFERSTHEEVIRQFRKIDEINFSYNRAEVGYKHWDNMPSPDSGGQVNVLKTEFNKKSRHFPIRKLVQEAGIAIKALKPVFMMSPLSIANFIPPGSLEFDLVVFDEASQVRPVDALGAILRAKQLVVVGDAKQLPPTSFFDSLTKESDDEENVTSDMQSILGMCDSQGVPNRMLRWHYRSKHESLISVSNHEFYDNKLIVFPSPGTRESIGLILHHLKDTAYDRGKTRTNPKEAEAVANAVLEHARKYPNLTLGVVAFSSAQRQAIQDILEIKRSESPDIENFFSKHKHEPFFVKNLENVQGDERDVIFISIGYGKTQEGYVSMSFGPLNNDGGERRLNVLITRAKLKCEVFTNLLAGDIDTSRSNKFGINALKNFLYFAEHGRLNLTAETGKEADSPFEEMVAYALERHGYIVRKQVGSHGFYLDLAIVDPENPGRYLIGIECDGASYHSARSARDRDRLRQQVLEGIGWKMHRIWSTDWFRNPEQELKRTIQAIEIAKQQHGEQDKEEEETIITPITPLTRDEYVNSVETSVNYTYAQLSSKTTSQELHTIAPGKLALLIEEVVNVESPVHLDEVFRRIAESYGVSRVGSRIRQQLMIATKVCTSNKKTQKKGEFLWATEMSEPIIRDRSEFQPQYKKISYVSPEELSLAIKNIVNNAVAINREAAIINTGRALGFGRVTEDIKKAIDTVINSMIKKGEIIINGEIIKIN